MEDQLGPDAPDLAAVHHNLAGLLCAQQRFTDAATPALRALARRTKAHPPDVEGLAADLSVLGAVLIGLDMLGQAQRQIDTAESEFQEALRIKERLLGPENREIAALLNNLGALETDRGNHEEAMPL